MTLSEDLERSLGPKIRPGDIRYHGDFTDGWNDCRDAALRVIASLELARARDLEIEVRLLPHYDDCLSVRQLTEEEGDLAQAGRLDINACDCARGRLLARLTAARLPAEEWSETP